MDNKGSRQNNSGALVISPAPAVMPEDRPLDKVKRPTEKRRSRERER